MNNENNNNNDDGNSGNNNIASRVRTRRRIWLHQDPTLVSSNRRRLLVKSGKSARSFRQQQRHRRQFNLFGGSHRKSDIELLQDRLGDYQHHGTGNPLTVRSPTTPKDYAVRTLAHILNEGVLGQTLEESPSTKFVLKTERGKSGSFWTSRVRLAGSYGWTGIILPKDADTSQPFPIENASWILVEDHDELRLLKSLVETERWRRLKDRIVTTSTLAKRLRRRFL